MTYQPRRADTLNACSGPIQGPFFKNGVYMTDSNDKLTPPEFAEGAMDSSTWPPAKRRKFSALMSQAYEEGYESGKDVECTNLGSLTNKQGSPTVCKCRNCSGARAALAKQAELTGINPLKVAQN